MAAKFPYSFTMKVNKETSNTYTLGKANSSCFITSLYLDKMWLSEVDEITQPVNEKSTFEVTIKRLT